MKKSILILAAGMLVLSLAACNNKSDNVMTEAAVVPTEAAAEEKVKETEAETEAEKTFDAAEKYADYESDFFQGEVTAIDGNVITVKGESGTEMFDLSGAECDEADILLEGSYAEIEYPILEERQKVTEAISVVVLMNIEEYADEMRKNPAVWGVVEVMDINELQIKDANGNECYFDNGISREISFGEITSGTRVLVTYMGTLDKEAQKSDEYGTGAGTPYAIKVVAEDAVNSEEGQADYICGVVNKIENNELMLDTEIMSLSFSAENNELEGFEENDQVKVYYEGVLSEEKAAKIAKVELWQ